MFAVAAPLLAALLLPVALSFPYPLLNTTTPVNATCDSSIPTPNGSSGACNTNPTGPSTTNATIKYVCQEVYPSDLTILDSRYPDYNTSHLHQTQGYFRLRRELPENGEIATRVQFLDLPSKDSNTTCRLEFILPRLDLQRIAGFNPTFNVYQVEQDTESIATWMSYVGNTGAALFGRVNGEPQALNRTRSIGGVAAINEMMCNETLTFQMGMTFNSKGGSPNY
jgi:hypothetical protein